MKFTYLLSLIGATASTTTAIALSPALAPPPNHHHPVTRSGVGTPLSPVTRDGARLYVDGQPWRAVGPNVYWLGLDENVVPPEGQPYYEPLKASYPTKARTTEVMAVVRALGGTMIRAHTLGVSTGNPLSVWPEAAVVNADAFEAIDWAVYEAGRYGVRLLVPLVDNYDYYHGGKYTFLRWAGYDLTMESNKNDPLIQQFYTNDSIVATFKSYVTDLLTHRNRFNNLTWYSPLPPEITNQYPSNAEDPTIFAYETGNELYGPASGDKDVPTAWLRDVARLVKALAPSKLLVDGTYGVNAGHFAVDEVDIFSDHFYPADVARLTAGVDAVETAGRAYFAGEYDWVGAGSGGDDLESFFKVIEDREAVAGDAFWSLFGHDAPACETFVDHGDGFTLQYGNPNNSAYTDSRIRLIREHFVKLSQGLEVGANATLPAVPCPVPAL
ncbi:glycoside hydrolase [Xylariomycetidae sp. FL2044]|nr:glycoside hydrolase [Xylariomycetidae sp. FL2044]